MSSVVLAKALYSNDSEADDELSFKKGDVITVLETDFDGMEGWWLCSLGDKQGVAPGNRLQLISFDDNDTGNLHDTSTQSYKEWYGEVDYDIPKQYLESQEEDYAIPKSPYGNYPVSDSQRHGFVLPSPRAVSAERNSNSSDGLVTNEIYAAPSSRYSSERSSDEFRFSGESEEMYDVPSRNSIESDDGQRNVQPTIPPKARDVHSNGRINNRSPSQGSQETYDSAAGSRNSNHSEIYDHLPGSEIYDQLPSNEIYNQLPSIEIYDQLPSNEIYDQLPNSDVQQVDQILLTVSGDGEDYATIPSPLPVDVPQEIYDVPPTGPDELYDVPGSGSEAFYNDLPVDKTDSLFKKNSVADGNNNPPVVPENVSGTTPVYEEISGGPEELYDNFAEKGLKADTGSLNRKKRLESDDYVDYQEIYGLSEDTKTIENDGSTKTEQSVLERIHMDKVRELRVTRVVAMHNLDRLQNAVDVGVTKLMSFVTDDWRRSEVYALNINGIREISQIVKVALRLLTEFGLGALKNSQKLPDAEISGKIEEALKPLLESYYSIKTAIQRLDESNWRSAYQEKPDDDLNTIAKLAQCIPCGAYNLGAVIANVSNILFTGEIQESSEPTTKTQNHTQNSLSPSTEETQTRQSPDPQRRSQESVSPLPVSPRIDSIQQLEIRRHSYDSSSTSPVTAQVESTKKPATSKTETEPVESNAAVAASSTAKTPPVVKPKPKRERKRSDSAPNTSSTISDEANAQLLSAQVSELTNNLLNEIDAFKPPQQNLNRKGSKKLSPRTVRRLCSISLKNDDRINEKIFEDVSAIPPKPSRQCSSPTNSNVDKRSSLTATISDPGSLHSDILTQNFQSMKSFVEKMNSEFLVLKEAIKSFGESVKERQTPKHFVAHSKFIVLSAHKLVYIGDGASRSVGADDRATISALTNALSEVINIFVIDIKIAARQYPEEAAMNNMIKSATNVTEKALGLYRTLKRQAQR